VAIEITTRWGDTLIDIAQVETGDFTLVDCQLVYGGQLVAAPEGQLGRVSYTAVEIPRAARSVPFARHGDRRWLPYVGLALIAHVGLWVVATIQHPPLQRRAPVTTERPIKIARIAAEPARSYVPPDDRARDLVNETKSQGQAKAMAGPIGAAGAISPNKRGHVAVKNTGEEAQLTKTEAVERARRAGILGSSEVLRESFATLGGADRLTSAFDAVDVTALTGGTGTSAGSFGVGYAGGGAGGGGTYGTIGVGHIGTFSNGTTHGHGWGGSHAPPTPRWRTWSDGDYQYTGGYPHRLRSRPSPVQICPHDAPPCTVDGALDKAIVRRYVKRNIQKLSYCYERELLARPKIRGLVHITFAVGDAGRVELARASGFDETVADCVRGVFESIELPRGATVVAYVLRFGWPN
jgi:hypothetical protein